METKARLKEVLENHFGDDDGFDLEFDPSAPDQITGLVTSSTFEGKREFERQNMIWDVLDDELTEEQRADIVLLMANTPEESEAFDHEPRRNTG